VRALVSRLVGAMLAIVCLATNIQAQDSSISVDRILASLRLGYNPSMLHAAVIAGAEVVLVRGADRYSVQAFYTSEMYRFGGYDGPDVPDETITGLGVAYGRSFSFTLGRPLFPLFPIPLLARKETLYYLNVSAGLSVNRSLTLDGSPRIVGSGGGAVEVNEGLRRTVVGVPVQLEFVQMLTPSVGYVHRIDGNINNARSFWAFSWAVQIGF
jgi:hypothetical protein